jgi:hypothetical protein
VTRLIVLLAAAATIAAGPLQTQKPPPPPPANVAGKWIITLVMAQGTATPTLELKQDGEKVTGTYTGRYGAFALQGTVKGRTLEFRFTMKADGADVLMTFIGDVAADGQSIKGDATLGEMGEASWTAKRDKGLLSSDSAWHP